jgi:DNA-binding MarR family transcriptional regulator
VRDRFVHSVKLPIPAARACNISPQAMNGVVATLERDGLVQRAPHPTHGRILQASLTDEGAKRLAAGV